MDLKCRHCGTELAGYETFCPGCGRELPGQSGAGFRPVTSEDTVEKPDELFPEEFAEPVIHRTARPRTQSPVQPRRQPQPRTAANPGPRRPQRSAPKPRRSKDLTPGMRRLLLIALCAVGVVMILLLGGMLFGKEARVTYPFTPVMDQYFTAVKTGNANTYIETRPPAYTAYLTAGSGSAYGSEGEYRAHTAATLQDRLAGYESEYGKVKSINYDLSEIRRYNHRCEALSDVLTGWYQFPEHAVTDAYIVSGAYTVQGTKGMGEYEFSDVLLIYMDGNWYFSPDAGNYWRAE